MTHDEAFAALRDRKRAEEEERDRGRVTWRKVSEMTGGGWSGIGAGGRLVFVRSRPAAAGGGYIYGRVEGRERPVSGRASRLGEAKSLAAALLVEAGANGSANGPQTPVADERSRLDEET